MLGSVLGCCSGRLALLRSRQYARPVSRGLGAKFGRKSAKNLIFCYFLTTYPISRPLSLSNTSAAGVAVGVLGLCLVCIHEDVAPMPMLGFGHSSGGPPAATCSGQGCDQSDQHVFLSALWVVWFSGAWSGKPLKQLLFDAFGGFPLHGL